MNISKKELTRYLLLAVLCIGMFFTTACSSQPFEIEASLKDVTSDAIPSPNIVGVAIVTHNILPDPIGTGKPEPAITFVLGMANPEKVSHYEFMQKKTGSADTSTYTSIGIVKQEATTSPAVVIQHTVQNPNMDHGFTSYDFVVLGHTIGRSAGPISFVTSANFFSHKQMKTDINTTGIVDIPKDPNTSLPTDIAQDSDGFLYVSDTENNQVVKIGAAGIISKVGGLNKPTGMCFNPIKKKISITNQNEDTITTLDTDLTNPANEKIGTFKSPSDCAFNPQETIGITYLNSNAVVFKKSDGTATTIGSFGSTEGKFTGPIGISSYSIPVSGTSLTGFVVIDKNSRLTFIDDKTTPPETKGSVEVTDIKSPGGITTISTTIGSDDVLLIYITDASDHKIKVFKPVINIATQKVTGVDKIAIFGIEGSDPAEFNEPKGLFINQTTKDLFIVDSKNNRIQAFKEPE